MKICILNYSFRKNGNCAGISNYVATSLLQQFPDVSLISMDFPAVGDHRCGNCAYDCFEGHCPYKADELQRIYEELLLSDMLISVVPVYSAFPCSNFFVLSERVQGAYDDSGFEKFDKLKNKYIFVGNNGDSAIKEIIRTSYHSFQDRDILFIRSHDVGERSIRGNLMDYEYYQEKIREFVSRLTEE